LITLAWNLVPHLQAVVLDLPSIRCLSVSISCIFAFNSPHAPASTSKVFSGSQLTVKRPRIFKCCFNVQAASVNPLRQLPAPGPMPPGCQIPKLRLYLVRYGECQGSGGVVRLSISPSQGGDPGFKSRPEHFFNKATGFGSRPSLSLTGHTLKYKLYVEKIGCSLHS
jgi:hypothetical protein